MLLLTVTIIIDAIMFITAYRDADGVFYLYLALLLAHARHDHSHIRQYNWIEIMVKCLMALDYRCLQHCLFCSCYVITASYSGGSKYNPLLYFSSFFVYLYFTEVFPFWATFYFHSTTFQSLISHFLLHYIMRNLSFLLVYVCIKM